MPMSALVDSPELLISGAPPLHQDRWRSLETTLRPRLGEFFGLSSESLIIDLNYGEQRREGLNSFCREIGIPCVGGLRMLSGQG